MEPPPGRVNDKRENRLLIKENDGEARQNGANGDLLNRLSL
jgi:hypothetical protein